MLRCSATTAVASPHMPVSLACFGSGLFNELEKTHDELETEGGEREREGERRRECVASITWSVTPQRRYQHKKFKHHQPLSSCCCCSPETRCRTGRRRSSSHLRPVAVQPRKRGEGSASSASAAAGRGCGTWAAAACCAVEHSEAHSTNSVTWVLAANVPQALHGRKRVSTEACEGPVSRCLVPAMHANGSLDRRHTQVGEELH